MRRPKNTTKKISYICAYHEFISLFLRGSVANDLFLDSTKASVHKSKTWKRIKKYLNIVDIMHEKPLKSHEYIFVWNNDKLCFFTWQEERERLGLTFDNDGEFYMALNDFLEQFDSMEICNVPSGAIMILNTLKKIFLSN